MNIWVTPPPPPTEMNIDIPKSNMFGNCLQDVFESNILVLYKAKEVQNGIFSVKMIKFSTKYGIGKYWQYMYVLRWLQCRAFNC